MKLGVEDARFILEHTLSEETAAQCAVLDDLLDHHQPSEFYQGYLTAMALAISMLCTVQTRGEQDQALLLFAALGKRACSLCLG